MALIASAVAGTREQGASVAFRRSNAGKRDRTFQVGIEALRGIDIALDMVFYALIPLGFAVAAPDVNALPAAVLIVFNPTAGKILLA